MCGGVPSVAEIPACIGRWMTDAELGSVLNLAPVYDHVNIAKLEDFYSRDVL